MVGFSVGSDVVGAEEGSDVGSGFGGEVGALDGERVTVVVVVVVATVLDVV